MNVQLFRYKTNVNVALVIHNLLIVIYIEINAMIIF